MTAYIGLLGAGNISRTHARAAAAIPGVRIAAVFGANPGKVAALAAENDATPYTDFEEFLRHRPMDLVAIGTPSGLHAEQGIAAARHGLHVLTEKPIGTTLAQADELIAESQKAGAKLGIFFQDRFKPGPREMRSAVSSGVLGKLVLAEAFVKWYRPPDYYANSRWRGTLALDGGGALINQGIHTIDLLLWVLGDPVAVQARCATAIHQIESEDTLLAIIEFANGLLASFVATTSVYPGYPRRINIHGFQGSLNLEDDRLFIRNFREHCKEDLALKSALTDARASSPAIHDVSGHQAVFDDFLRAIETDSRPACDGREARRSLAVIEAIYLACRTGDRVCIV